MFAIAGIGSVMVGLAATAVGLACLVDARGREFAAGRVLTCMLCALVALVSFVPNALADDGSTSGRTASLPGFAMGGDLLWAGDDFELSGTTVNNDVLAAGASIDIKDVRVQGSVRAAGRDVSLQDVVVGQSVTVAGQDVSVSATAGAIALAGRQVSFEGECDELFASGTTVRIDGVVHGDAQVHAARVVIGDNAVVEGTLEVSADEEPVVSGGARVPGLDYEPTENAEESLTAVDFAGTKLYLPIRGTAALCFSVLDNLVMRLALSVLGVLLTALIAEWLLGGAVRACAVALGTRTGATVGTGILGALVAPLAVVALCILVATVPLALGLALALVAMTLVAEGFMAAVLGKLFFAKLGRYRSTLAMAVIVGVLGAVPFVGYLLTPLCFVVMLGCAAQAVYLAARAQAASSLPSSQTSQEA